MILHPEWPTYKKQTGLLYGQYGREHGKYRPSIHGRAGFVDFAIGDYYRPEIGIEFSLKYGWSHEEIVYDFLKLLDKKNPFETSISLNVLFRHWGVVTGKSLTNLDKRINDAVGEALSRLNIGGSEISREPYFIVTEVDKNDNRRHWYYHQAS